MIARTQGVVEEAYFLPYCVCMSVCACTHVHAHMSTNLWLHICGLKIQAYGEQIYWRRNIPMTRHFLERLVSEPGKYDTDN